MTRRVTYQPDVHDLIWVFEEHGQGATLLCPVCGADLIVALDRPSAARLGVHPGIFCPVDENHVSELITLAAGSETVPAPRLATLATDSDGLATVLLPVGDTTLVARCRPELEDAAHWLLDEVSVFAGQGRPLAAGANVQVGWAILTLRPHPAGLVLCEPDFATDPFKNVVPDVSRTLQVNAAHATMLRRLPAGMEGQPVVFHERLVVARGCLEDMAEVVAQRDTPAFRGHCGWYVAPIEGGLANDLPPQERFETPFVYELLRRRPSLLPVLVLPLGSEVVFDGDRVDTVRLPHGRTLKPGPDVA